MRRACPPAPPARLPCPAGLAADTRRAAHQDETTAPADASSAAAAARLHHPPPPPPPPDASAADASNRVHRLTPSTPRCAAGLPVQGSADALWSHPSLGRQPLTWSAHDSDANTTRLSSATTARRPSDVRLNAAGRQTDGDGLPRRLHRAPPTAGRRTGTAPSPGWLRVPYVAAAAAYGHPAGVPLNFAAAGDVAFIDLDACPCVDGPERAHAAAVCVCRVCAFSLARGRQAFDMVKPCVCVCIGDQTACSRRCPARRRPGRPAPPHVMLGELADVTRLHHPDQRPSA